MSRDKDDSEQELTEDDIMKKAETFKSETLESFSAIENIEFGKLCFADGYKQGYKEGMEVMRTLLDKD